MRDLDGKEVVKYNQFATSKYPVVDEDVHFIANAFVQFYDAALGKLQHVFDEHVRAAEFDAETQRHVQEQIDVIVTVPALPAAAAAARAGYRGAGSGRATHGSRQRVEGRGIETARAATTAPDQGVEVQIGGRVASAAGGRHVGRTGIGVVSHVQERINFVLGKTTVTHRNSCIDRTRMGRYQYLKQAAPAQPPPRPMTLFRSSVRLGRRKLRIALVRVRRRLRQRLKTPTTTVQEYESALHVTGLPPHSIRYPPVRLRLDLRLLTLRSRLVRVGGQATIRVRAELRPLLGVPWRTKTEPTALALKCAREEAGRRTIGAFLVAHSHAHPERHASGGDSTNQHSGLHRSAIDRFALAPVPHGQDPRLDFEQRRLLILPFNCAREDLERLLPPPFAAPPEDRLYLYAYVDGGSSTDRFASGKEPALHIRLACEALLVADHAPRTGLLTFRAHVVRLDRPRLPWDGPRAAFAFGTDGILLSMGSADRRTHFRARMRATRVIRSGDALPPLLSDTSLQYHFDPDLSALVMRENQNDFILNRVYVAERIPIPGPTPEAFIQEITGLEVQATRFGWFCPRVDVHAVLRILAWDQVQYRAAGSARTGSILAPVNA